MSLSSPAPIPGNAHICAVSAPVPSKLVVDTDAAVYPSLHHPSFASCTVPEPVLQFVCLA